MKEVSSGFVWTLELQETDGALPVPPPPPPRAQCRVHKGMCFLCSGRTRLGPSSFGDALVCQRQTRVDRPTESDALVAEWEQNPPRKKKGSTVFSFSRLPARCRSGTEVSRKREVPVPCDHGVRRSGGHAGEGDGLLVVGGGVEGLLEHRQHRRDCGHKQRRSLEPRGNGRNKSNNNNNKSVSIEPDDEG